MHGEHGRTGTLAVPGHRSRRPTVKQGTRGGSSLGKGSGNCGDSEWLRGWGGAGGEGWEHPAEDPEGTPPGSLAPDSLLPPYALSTSESTFQNKPGLCHSGIEALPGSHPSRAHTPSLAQTPHPG